MELHLNTVSISFIVFLLLMVVIGIFSSSQAKHNSEDYLLASRNVHAWVVALSTFSTALSGFMFIGYIGYTFTHGLSSIWHLLTWAFGDLLAWFTIHRRLREKSAERSVTTITSFIGTCDSKPRTSVIKFASILGFVFLAVYAAAQLKVSSKALHAILGWDYSLGVIIAGAIVCLYCFSGGIRASIWTDVVQSILMYIAMFTLVAVAVDDCGGFSGLFSSLQAIDPNLVQLIPENLKGHFMIFLLSLLLNGYGVIGQPHIMVRPMAIDKPESVAFARNLYFFAYLSFGLASLLVGLTARVLMPEIMNADTELALPQLAIKLLPEILIGLILAGIFSASISTADSQILSCSASVTQDLFPKWKKSYQASKLATLVVSVLAIAIALSSSQSVFDLVLVAWSVLAVSIGPLLFMRCFDIKVESSVSLVMMLSSSATIIIWRYLLPYSEQVHEVLPGVVVALVAYFLFRKIS